MGVRSDPPPRCGHAGQAEGTRIVTFEKTPKGVVNVQPDIARRWTSIPGLSLLGALLGTGCGNALTHTTTVVQTVTQTRTLTVQAKPTTVQAKPTISPRSGGSSGPSSNSPPNELTMGIDLAKAVQASVGSRYQVSSSGSDCLSGVNEGNYSCDVTDSQLDDVHYNVAASGGKWSGTLAPAQSSASATGSVPRGYPTTVKGTY